MNSKRDPKRISADWSRFQRRPTWCVVSSRELAGVLGVSLQTICNWHLRGILPAPEPRHPALRGNKNYYRISKIRAWLEGRSEDAIHWTFVQSYMNLGVPYTDLEQAQSVAKIVYEELGIEKPLI